MTPLENPKVTSCYGWRTLNGIRQFHNGQDMVDARGKRGVRAIWAGKCDVSKGWNGGRGNLVNVYYNGALRAVNQHLDSFAVSHGQTVKQGQVIGNYGNTGESYGAHLHIEIQQLVGVRWTAIAPSPYTEVPNSLGVHPGNNNLDGQQSPPPYKPPTGLVVLKVGPMSNGDRDTMEKLAGSLALSCNAQKTNGQETTLLIGPMSAGDRQTVEAKAKGIALPCSVWSGQVTLLIGPASSGDRQTLESKAKELGVHVKFQEVGGGLVTLTVGPMGPAEKQVMEATASKLLLPVGVA